MKIHRIKFFNAVKVGKREIIYTDEKKDGTKYDINLIDDKLIKLVDTEDGSIIYTSVFNTVWFEPVEN